MTAPSLDRMREAAALIRHHAGRATPGPWRLADTAVGGKYAALVANTPHPHRGDPHPHRGDSERGGWAWDDGYGGCLVGESLMTGDRLYPVAVQPRVGLAVADVLDHAADAGLLTEPLVALADRVLGIAPPEVVP